jgi:two-component system, chemotaxis family, CheB/CheR fusion protein
VTDRPGPGPEADADGDLEILLELIRDTRGFDFTGYKRPSLTRRIRKRMQEVGAGSFSDYARMLEAEPDEFTALFNTILINVTELLRDADAWRYLEREVLPHLRAEGRQIRVWSAGCSTGEEAYTLAVLLASVLGDERYQESVKIYATDADDDALRQARAARFPLRSLVDAFGEDRAEACFERNDVGYALRPDLRRAIVFGRHDLVQDPPISRVDLLVCRNTLMYFNADVQRKVLANFHFALNDDGCLFLGRSEALVTRTNLFLAVDPGRHVFRKHPQAPPVRPPLPPPPPADPADTRRQARNLLEAAYDSWAPAQFAVDTAGTVVASNRQARTVLGIGLAQVGRPLRDLEVSYRPVELRGPIEQALAHRRPVTLSEVEHRQPTGETVYFDVVVLPVERAGALLGATATFVDVTAARQLRQELERSQRELEIAYEELQSTVEELETTNEELHSTNEELETTNEELHSTNEELETMNEELQSTNEELETLNTELRRRTSELDEANQFLESVLGSLHAGVAVLDTDLMVRAWNAQAQELWGLRPDEVVGHSFLNLDIGLPVGELRQPVWAALSGAEEKARLVVKAVNRRGREIACVVVIAPMNGEGRVGGAVVMMEDGSDDSFRE